MKRGGDKEKILPPTLFLELLTRKCCNFLRCKSRAEFQRQLISCLEQFERLRVHGCIRRQTHIGHLHSRGKLALKEIVGKPWFILRFIYFVNPSCFYICILIFLCDVTSNNNYYLALFFDTSDVRTVAANGGQIECMVHRLMVHRRERRVISLRCRHPVF